MNTVRNTIKLFQIKQYTKKEDKQSIYNIHIQK